jgi:hypothetical protein
MKKNIIFLVLFSISFFYACKNISISVIEIPNEIPKVFSEKQIEVINTIRFEYFKSFLEDFQQSKMNELVTSDTTLFIVEYYERNALPIECYEYNLVRLDSTFIISYCKPGDFKNIRSNNNLYSFRLLNSLYDNDYSELKTGLEKAVKNQENISPYYDLYCYKVIKNEGNIQIKVVKLFRIDLMYK